jgi:hypothetical protein
MWKICAEPPFENHRVEKISCKIIPLRNVALRQWIVGSRCFEELNALIFKDLKSSEKTCL